MKPRPPFPPGPRAGVKVLSVIPAAPYDRDVRYHVQHDCCGRFDTITHGQLATRAQDGKKVCRYCARKNSGAQRSAKHWAEVDRWGVRPRNQPVFIADLITSKRPKPPPSGKELNAMWDRAMQTVKEARNAG